MVASIKTSQGSIGLKRFYEDEIRPNEYGYFEVMPQTLFKPSNLEVSEECKKSFDIIDIRVGRNSVFVSENPIPASTIEKAKLDWQTCHVGQRISIIVKNKSNKPLKFESHLNGLYAE